MGSSGQDALTWTCGGPVSAELDLRPCRDMGITPDGVVAAVGYFDGDAQAELRSSDRVARVAELQDAVTGLLFDVGGFGVERPGPHRQRRLVGDLAGRPLADSMRT